MLTLTLIRGSFLGPGTFSCAGQHSAEGLQDVLCRSLEPDICTALCSLVLSSVNTSFWLPPQTPSFIFSTEKDCCAPCGFPSLVTMCPAHEPAQPATQPRGFINCLISQVINDSLFLKPPVAIHLPTLFFSGGRLCLIHAFIAGLVKFHVQCIQLMFRK